MPNAFHLHARLEQDCIPVGHFELCQLLMMNDSQYPWFILVPEVAGATEMYQLTKTQRALLIEESCYLAEILAGLYQADKMNIAAIGNLVPQLHIHHVVRYQTDIAWPGPIWGKFPALPYTEQQVEDNLLKLKSRLKECYWNN
jgi:diadenosine tetraphosphate (Ap4A) HIT family hydrolase